MPYVKELDMYEPVRAWLERRLKEEWKQGDIFAYDTHDKRLSDFINENGLHEFVQDHAYSSFDIKVDITGFIRNKSNSGMVFVECKIPQASLRDLGQILGYSRIARPLQSYLISNTGISPYLKSLITVYGRRDVLEYYEERGTQPRMIEIRKWNQATEDLDYSITL